MEIQNHIDKFDKYYSNHGQHWLDGVDDYWTRLAYSERNYNIIGFVFKYKPESILDIGCGTGDLILDLKELLVIEQLAINHKEFAKEIIGVEPSSVNARKFEQNTGLPVYVNIAEELPFGHDAFDCVILADVIEHVVDPEKTLAEAIRVLKPKGHLIITTPNKVADILWSFGSKRLFNKKEVKDDLFTKRQLKKLIKDVVFNGCNVEHFIDGIYPRSRLLSLIFNQDNNIMMKVLRVLYKFEFLRYRQYIIIEKE